MSAKPARQSEPEPDDDFAGMTNMKCPDGCQPDCCVITVRGVCGHPSKGGLQAALVSDAAIVERYRAARAYLVRKKAEDDAKR